MSVLVKYNSNSDLSRMNVDEIKLALRKKLAGRVDAAYIFGSFARGSHDENSDIDLILIADTGLPFTKRALKFIDLMDIFPAMDILVYTQSEFDRLLADPAGFWKSAKANLKKLI